MRGRNYLIRDRTHYTINLKDKSKKKYVQLWEHIDGANKTYKNAIAIAYSWRAEILQKFLDRLIEKYHQDLKNRIVSYQTVLANEGFIIDTKKTHWNHEYKLNNELAMKMLFSIKLVSKMKKRPRIEEALEILYSLTDEEVSFWSWKVLSLKIRALTSFKAMYL